MILLSNGFKRLNGRSKNGFIIFRRRGCQRLNLYRFIDFFLFLAIIFPYIVIDFVYDSFRNSLLMGIMYLNGIFSYRIGINKVIIGSLFLSNILTKECIKDASVTFLFNISVGKFICNIPCILNKKIGICRSAGMGVQLLKLDIERKIGMLKLQKSKKYILSSESIVVFGKVCNLFFRYIFHGKAGYKINRGKRPVVRGIARNPVDHPNGGRTHGGKVFRSLFGNIVQCNKKRSTSYLRNYFLRNQYII
jgi:large subunit ribosomal protein L2